MIKSELISLLSDKNPHLTQKDIERVVNAIFGEISNSLSSGKRVEIRGFGSFSVRHRSSRKGRNPRTGEEVSVPEKNVPFFKTGKDLKEKLNRK